MWDYHGACFFMYCLWFIDVHTVPTLECSRLEVKKGHSLRRIDMNRNDLVLRQLHGQGISPCTLSSCLNDSTGPSFALASVVKPEGFLPWAFFLLLAVSPRFTKATVESLDEVASSCGCLGLNRVCQTAWEWWLKAATGSLGFLRMKDHSCEWLVFYHLSV